MALFSRRDRFVFDLDRRRLCWPKWSVLRRRSGAVGFDRITRVAQADEIDALDHATVFDVEARDDSLGQHQSPSSAEKASDNVKAPE